MSGHSAAHTAAHGPVICVIRTWIIRIARTAPGMAIARSPSMVVDCADPGALATFYGALLDGKVDVSSDWAEVRADYGQCIFFQQVESYTPPGWPNQEVPQQMHLDVIVDALDVGEASVLDLEATKYDHQPDTSFRLLLDPAGASFPSLRGLTRPRRLLVT